jgi:hypothetical protein
MGWDRKRIQIPLGKLVEVVFAEVGGSFVVISDLIWVMGPR